MAILCLSEMSSPAAAHVIGGLKTGGVENFLQGLVELANCDGVRFVIVAVYQRSMAPREVSFASPRVYAGHLLYERRSFLRCIREVFREENVKVVHSHLGELSGDILRMAGEWGVPVRIAHSHDLGGVGGLRWFFYRRYARGRLGWATHFASVCASAGKVFQGLEPRPFKIIPAGIDEEKWQRDEEGGRRIRQELGFGDDVCLLLQVGRLVPEKNPLFSLCVLKILQRWGFPSALVYAGEGPLRRQIEVLAQRKNLFDRVRLLGNRKDVRQLMSAGDVLLMPSLREGLPRVLLEAWCVGLPFFLSDRVVVSDVFSGDYSLSLASPEEWARAIVKQAEKRNSSIKLLKDISLRGAWRECLNMYGSYVLS